MAIKNIVNETLNHELCTGRVLDASDDPHGISHVKKVLIYCGLLCCSLLHAETSWFTVTGDPANPAVSTVEVDPTPVSVQEERRSMRIRVSRSTQRTSWDGVPYRSYVSTVLFDCTSNTARYVSLEFYRAPLWQGKSHSTAVYTQDQPRAMQFRDVTPNPTERLIKAACQSGNVTITDK